MALDTQRNLNFISIPGIHFCCACVMHVFGARLRAPQLKLKCFWHPRERRQLHLHWEKKKKHRTEPYLVIRISGPGFSEAKKLCRPCNPRRGGGGEEKKRERERREKKETTLEHSENEEKPRRQMAETISPIRRSYFSCHARVCEDAVSITEHRHEAELLPLFWLDD